MYTIFIWPDQSWIFSHEYDDVEDAWRGDDFKVDSVSKNWSLEDIEVFIQLQQ